MAREEKRNRGRPKARSEVTLAEARRLERNGVVPLYFQLATALLELLQSRAWPPGTRFATERELEVEFGVSRVVVRKALKLLVGDGVIERVKGSGAFIRAPRHRLPVLGVVKAITHSHPGISLSILTAREGVMEPAIAGFLDLEDEEPRVAHVTALVVAGGQPVGLIDSHTSIARAPGVLSVATSLQAGAGAARQPMPIPTKGDALIEHTFFGRWDGGKIGASAGDPALLVRLIQFGKPRAGGDERPVEFARSIFRSDRTQLCAHT